jgi:HEAT repeat protein
MARSATDPQVRQSYIERVRKVMLDPAASDRITAAETLAKLSSGNPVDLPALQQWIAASSDSDATMALWLTAITGDVTQRSAAEARLAQILESSDPIARLRAAFSLGRMASITPATLAQILKRLEVEPADSPARVFLFIAAQAHDPAAPSQWTDALRQIVRSGPVTDQLHAATALGLRGGADDLPLLATLAKSSDGDARIGAADGSLRIQRRIRH